MGGDLSLKVTLRAQDLASGNIRGFGAVLSALSSPAKLATAGLLAAAAAAAAVAVQSVQMAAQYQQSMNMVQALTGASSQQMAYYDGQLKQLAMNAGVAPNALAQGLYQVISAGYSGADAMRVLTLSTEDSKIGMTDAKTTAEALTNVLANFSWQTKDANQVNGIMLETVTLGKSTFQQYASQITKAASTSAQFKISLQTMSAAWATMTANGISAGKASTDYVQLVQAMDGKIGTITKSLHKNGIAFNETAFNAASFGTKVQMLNGALEQATKKHVTITGVTLQAAQALTVISGHMSTYNNNLKTLSDKQAMAQKTQQAWAITQGGFNQTMSRLGATVQVLLIDIGQQLLPVLTKIGQAVIPVITNFAAWITKSGIVTTGLNLVGGSIKGIIGFIGNLVTGIGNVVSFFQKNQVAAAALLIPLGVLAAILVAMGVAAIPGIIATIGALIAGFIAWAAAAGAAAIATLAATWPILAIGAAIGLLIGLVILIIKHWSGIAAFFEGLWNRVKAIFWVTVAILQQVWNNILSSLQNAWNNIVGFVKGALQRLWDTFTAPFRAIGALFQWLYNHNTYFKKLVDKIHQIVVAALAILHNIWQKAIDFVVGLWNGLVSKATGAWNAVTGAIQKGVNAVVGWVRSQIQSHVEDLRQKWFMLQAIVQQAWQKVQSVISGAWNNYIVTPLQNLWNSIKNFANGWPKDALNWGVNLVQGFINGITSMLGNVKNAAGNIIGSVGKLLGFHSPAKEGPGMHIIEWGSGMVQGFSSGVIAAIPTLQAAVNLAVRTGTLPMSSPASSPALGGAIPYGRPPMSNSYSSIGGNNHYGNNTFVIQGANSSPDAIAAAIENRLNQKYRRSGLMGNLAAGARNS